MKREREVHIMSEDLPGALLQCQSMNQGRIKHAAARIMHKNLEQVIVGGGWDAGMWKAEGGRWEAVYLAGQPDWI